MPLLWGCLWKIPNDFLFPGLDFRCLPRCVLFPTGSRGSRKAIVLGFQYSLCSRFQGAPNREARSYLMALQRSLVTKHTKIGLWWRWGVTHWHAFPTHRKLSSNHLVIPFLPHFLFAANLDRPVSPITELTTTHPSLLTTPPFWSQRWPLEWLFFRPSELGMY